MSNTLFAAKKFLIKQATIINQGQEIIADLLINNGKIVKITSNISNVKNAVEINAENKYLLPGAIDDQVHFREPGLTHKADIFSESKAAVAGGITSYMEMPNVNPPSITIELLEQKYQIAKQNSFANYSFYLGATQSNLEEIKRLEERKNQICGLKIFMGSSTGNMLVDNQKALEQIFYYSPCIITTHCENPKRIKANLDRLKAKLQAEQQIKKQIGKIKLRPEHHPIINNAQACLDSSKLAAEIALANKAKLHILHITTKDEIDYFRQLNHGKTLKEKQITLEACTHHLWFCDSDYQKLGNLIKCNPAIKTAEDRNAIVSGVVDNTIDVIATDHAPHTLDEKRQCYEKAPAGLPQVQRSLNVLLELVHYDKFNLLTLVDKIAHAPAELFQIKERGFIKEGYWADLVLIDLQQNTEDKKSDLYYKCQWSPWQGQRFNSKILATFVSGSLAFYQNQINPNKISAQRLEFTRD